MPDVLGPGFEALTLPLGEDAEGELVATLVRRKRRASERARGLIVPGPLEDVDVVYVHGWSDYFFNPWLADQWAQLGARFYALDLRKYGRSLREGQSPGYVTDLADYDADIDAAIAASAAERGGRRRRLVMMGHSTGGLTLSLWAHRNPGRADALVLNSPWLEFQVGGLGRETLAPLVALGARIAPGRAMPNVDLGFYARAVSKARGGEWEYEDAWRPERGFPVRPAWLATVLDGHERVARGLSIDVPVLAQLSTRSTLGTSWSEEMRHTDSVLAVADIAHRAIGLGHEVTVGRIDGALHDIMLSAEPVRATAFGQIRRWATGFLQSD